MPPFLGITLQRLKKKMSGKADKKGGKIHMTFTNKN